MPNLHRNVNLIYKFILIILSALISFTASSDAVLVFSFSVLWILMDNIENSVEASVQYLHKKWHSIKRSNT